VKQHCDLIGPAARLGRGRRTRLTVQREETGCPVAERDQIENRKATVVSDCAHLAALPYSEDDSPRAESFECDREITRGKIGIERGDDRVCRDLQHRRCQLWAIGNNQRHPVMSANAQTTER